MLVTKLSLSLTLAQQIADAAIGYALANNQSVSIAIVNEAGYLLYFSKMDDSTNASGDIAIAKAKHAVNYRRDTKYHEDFLAQGQLRVLALPGTLPIEGGMQLIYEGKLVGAIGVSGAPAVEDGQIAKAGVDKLAAIHLHE